MMDRRIFIQGAAVIVTVPVIANLLLPSSSTPSNPEPLPVHSASPKIVSANVLLQIRGWDCCSDDGSQAVIRMTQSWRTAWR
jgi:hypothetical protein